MIQCQDDYFLSFFFVLDVVSTVTLVHPTGVARWILDREHFDQCFFDVSLNYDASNKGNTGVFVGSLWSWSWSWGHWLDLGQRQSSGQWRGDLMMIFHLQSCCTQSLRLRPLLRTCPMIVCLALPKSALEHHESFGYWGTACFLSSLWTLWTLWLVKFCLFCLLIDLHRLIRIIKLYKAIYEARQLQKKKEADCELIVSWTYMTITTPLHGVAEPGDCETSNDGYTTLPREWGWWRLLWWHGGLRRCDRQFLLTILKISDAKVHLTHLRC